MSSTDYPPGNVLVSRTGDAFPIAEEHGAGLGAGYDPDLLYVECRFCGKPVLWDKGKTAMLVRASGIDVTLLDAECMILSEGCPLCRPHTPLFPMRIVRVAAFSPQELLLLGENGGNA